METPTIPIIEDHEVQLKELGWCTARHTTDDLLDKEGEANYLLIFSPSSITDMIASPAQDIRISGKRNILKLRDFLNQIYPPNKKESNNEHD